MCVVYMRTLCVNSKSSIVIAADDSLVSFGPSPTYGELVIQPTVLPVSVVSAQTIVMFNTHMVCASSQGYGEGKKSSTRPAEVKTIHGSYVQQVACGMGHTLLLVRNDSDDDQKAIDKLLVFKPCTT